MAASKSPLRHLEARQVALAAVQRGQRFRGGAVAQLQAGGQGRRGVRTALARRGDAPTGADMLHQCLHREAVAGVQPQCGPLSGSRRSRSSCSSDARLSSMGIEPSLDAPVGPQQTLGEGRQLGALAAAGDQQRRTEHRLEAAQHAPAVAVRQPAGTACAGRCAPPRRWPIAAPALPAAAHRRRRSLVSATIPAATRCGRRHTTHGHSPRHGMGRVMSSVMGAAHMRTQRHSGTAAQRIAPTPYRKKACILKPHGFQG